MGIKSLFGFGQARDKPTDKAADAGYKIIIVIAGISSLLRKQTQFRINCSFVGQTDLNKDEPENRRKTNAAFCKVNCNKKSAEVACKC